jgi:C-terminal processing protease CtpA/Prc
MINLDMIGRLRDERLTVQGSRSGHGWRRLVSEQNDLAALRLTFDWRLTDDADHYPFFRMAVPVLTLHTGLHDEYHTPRDKPSLLNADGMQRVTRLVFGLMHELAEAETTPMFRPLAGRETEETRRAVENRMPAVGERLGVGWAEEASAAEGVRLARVNPRSAAARAGLRAGDDIVEFAGRPIASGEDLREAVRGASNPAKAVVQRGDQREEIAVTLDGSPMRWGIMWRVDDAERGTVVLTYVAPGSPAAEAGLERGDRIYQVDGHDFGDDAAFAARMAAADDMVTLSVEREGRLRVVAVSASASRRRAA